MASLGLTPDNLYYISIEEYISRNPELRGISSDLQERRFRHYDEKRKNRIETAIEKRKELIELESKNKKLLKSTSANYILEQGSTMLNNERQKLELLKNQQICELKNIIEFEFKLEDIRKKNLEKQKLQEQKEEEQRQMRAKQQKEKELMQKILDKKKEEKMQEEYLQMVKKEKERQIEERKKYLEEQKRLREAEKEREKKQKEQALKAEKFKEKIENIREQQNQRIQEKIKELRLKELQQKKNLAEIRRERDIETRNRQRKTEEKIHKALTRNDNNKSSKQGEYIKKQEIAEEIRKKFAEEKLQKSKIAEQHRKEKEKEILEVIKRNDEILQKKYDDYNKKQQEILERQKEKEKENQKLLLQKKYEQMQKERKCILARKKNEMIIERNREVWLSRINSSVQRIEKNRETQNRETLERFVESTMKKEDIEDNIKIKENIMGYQRDKKLQEIKIRDDKIKFLQKEKEKIYEQRRKMANSLARNKENLLKKFNKIMEKRNQNTTKEDIFKELFGEDYLKTSETNPGKRNRSAMRENDKVNQTDIYNNPDTIDDGIFLTGRNYLGKETRNKENLKRKTAATNSAEESEKKIMEKEEFSDKYDDFEG